MEIEVAVAPHIFSTFESFNITNSILATILLSVGVIVAALVLKKKMKLVPNRVQFLLESLYDYFAEQSAMAFGEDKVRARQVTVLISSLFIFLVLVNQFSIFPFLSQFQWDGEALFRTPTTDINLPFALTLIVLAWCHITAFAAAPLKHLGKFIVLDGFRKIRKPKDIGPALINFFLGILDIIGEISKVLSLSFRLFGNMIAGEIIILIIAGLSIYTSYIVPIPFIVLSTFSGLVQAFVFSILCLNFINAMVPPSRKFRKMQKAAQPELSGELLA
jgi:F-type H+-transporting ATPase subunit a